MNTEGSEWQRFSGFVVDHQDFGVEDHVVAFQERLGDEVLEVRHFVVHHRLQASRVILEFVALFVQLNSFAVVFDL